MIADLVRDSLGRVAPRKRIADVDARVVAFDRACARLVGLVALVRAEGGVPHVSGLDLLVAEGLELVAEARAVGGYDEVAGAVLGVMLGLTDKAVARG